MMISENFCKVSLVNCLHQGMRVSIAMSSLIMQLNVRIMYEKNSMKKEKYLKVSQSRNYRKRYRSQHYQYTGSDTHSTIVFDNRI